MLDLLHLPTPGGIDVQRFFGANIGTAVDTTFTWIKPRGKSMLHILFVGGGGDGGTGVIGANSTAAGGGGGGSGSQLSMLIPMWAIPDALYILMGRFNGYASYITIAPHTSASASAPAANIVLAQANGASPGGNASGATAGTAGAAPAAPSANQMPAGWAYVQQAIAGMAGIAGGTTVAGAALTLPVTGQNVTGGTGGGGLPAAATAGTNGGAFTVPTTLGVFPAQAGGVGAAAATTPAGLGLLGLLLAGGYLNGGYEYRYGGTGGGSTHGSATGAGLVQAAGGNGAPGCGAGGMGGALTGSTAAVAARGGSPFAILTAF